MAAIGSAGFVVPEFHPDFAEVPPEELKRDGYRTILLFRVREGSGLSPGATAAHALQMSGIKAEFEEFRKNAGLYLVSRLPGELSTEDDVWELRKYEHNADFPRRIGFPRVNKGLA